MSAFIQTQVSEAWILFRYDFSFPFLFSCPGRRILIGDFQIPKDVTADNVNFDLESVQIDCMVIMFILNYDSRDQYILLIVNIGSDGHAGTYPVSWLISHSNEVGKRTTAASGPRVTFRYIIPLFH